MLKHVVVPIVIDTNVLVPSLYRSTHILQFILSGNLCLVYNKFIYDEAVRITKKMWNTWYSTRMDPEQLTDVLDLLEIVFNLGYYVEDMPETWPLVSPDRDDDPFLWAAQAGRAEFIISSDRRHMLKLTLFNGIPIGRPFHFFAWVQLKYPMKAP